jgi:nucleoid-associated protein YgaU
MARKKATKAKTSKKTAAEKSSGGLLDYFRFGDSYTSLVLGIIVVILAVILLAALFRNRDFSGITPTNQPTKDTSSISTGPEVTPSDKGKYTIKEGDTLWSIAEVNLGDGYRFVEIAKLNNLQSADVIAVGTVLTLPQKAQPTKTVVETPGVSQSPSQMQNAPKAPNAITGATYVIKADDTLWDIAVRKYNDGYRWPEIARVNNIANPDLIFSGSTLKFPQ